MNEDHPDTPDTDANVTVRCMKCKTDYRTDMDTA